MDIIEHETRTEGGSEDEIDVASNPSFSNQEQHSSDSEIKIEP